MKSAKHRYKIASGDTVGTLYKWCEERTGIKMQFLDLCSTDTGAKLENMSEPLSSYEKEVLILQ